VCADSERAPLRGPAGLELVVAPFPYRHAAAFWSITAPRLALRVHAVVGGTPAYGREFVQGDAPSGPDDFDAWVRRTVLNPQTPLFREARYLLAAETTIREPAIYHSVLAAIASGNTNGGIAAYIGRRSDELSRLLTVEDAALVVREPGLFRGGRSATRSMPRSRDRISRRSAGLSPLPALACSASCRPRSATAVNDPAERAQIQVDVADFAAPAPAPDAPRRILSVGEAKWAEVMGLRHLARARDPLAAKKYDTSGTVLTCSAVGFDQDLRDWAARTPATSFSSALRTSTRLNPYRSSSRPRPRTPRKLSKERHGNPRPLRRAILRNDAPGNRAPQLAYRKYLYLAGGPADANGRAPRAGA
jgi:uncharacterized protein